MSKFGTRIKIQKRGGENFILVFSIEFYDFWRKPHLNRIKRRKVTAYQRNSNFPPNDHIWSN